ncbi:hypothetical protein SDC9_81736 [bioreactor metagenome]|uniref:Uncharacterized protein n=1 Tax=bioreactor metagenome TaxID=1076179 RepID=A0A644Z2R3_9ZZZZ|nr:hypothetical protein [Erysipelotrichaceae bacterium]
MNLRNIFPYSAQVKDISNLIIALVVYAIVAVLANVLLGLLGNLWFVGWLFSLLGWLINVYCGLGAVVAILIFFKVI